MRKLLFLSFIAQLFIYKRNIVASETDICQIWKSIGLPVPFFCLLFKKKSNDNYDTAEKREKNKETKIVNIEKAVNAPNDTNVRNNENSNDINDTENTTSNANTNADAKAGTNQDSKEQADEELKSLNDLYLNKLDIKELQDLNYLFPSFKDKVLLSKQENYNDDVNTDISEEDSIYYDDIPSDLKINLGNFTQNEKLKDINDEGLIVKVNGKLYNLKDIEVKKTNYGEPKKGDNIRT